MEELKNTYRRTAIIGFAMMMALVTYIVVVVVIEDIRGTFEAVTYASLLRKVFLVASLTMIVLIQILKGRLYRYPSSTTGTEKPDPKELLQRLVSTSVITLALAELIAVLGLVLFVLTNKSTDFYLFLAISLVTFTLFFPRYSQWEEWMKRRLMEHPSW